MRSLGRFASTSLARVVGSACLLWVHFAALGESPRHREGAIMSTLILQIARRRYPWAILAILVLLLGFLVPIKRRSAEAADPTGGSSNLCDSGDRTGSPAPWQKVECSACNPVVSK